MIRQHVAGLCIVFNSVVCGHWAVSSIAAHDLDVHVEIASDVIVLNDCQIALATVTNNSRGPIELDQPFHLLSCGPKIELRRNDEKFETVNASLQLNEHCNDDERSKDIVGAGQSVAEYLVLSRADSAGRMERRLFDAPGKYELRVSVSVKGEEVFSDLREFQVRADRRVDFRDESTSRALKAIIAHPRPTDVRSHAKVLANVPKESLLYQMGTLGTEAYHFVQAPDQNRARWIERRDRAPRILADRISLLNALDFALENQNELALEEFRRMKVESFFARSYRQEVERKLKRK